MWTIVVYMITVMGYRVNCDGYTAGIWEYDNQDLPPDECAVCFDAPSARDTRDAWEAAKDAGWGAGPAGSWDLCPWCVTQEVRYV